MNSLTLSPDPQFACEKLLADAGFPVLASSAIPTVAAKRNVPSYEGTPTIPPKPKEKRKAAALKIVDDEGIARRDGLEKHQGSISATGSCDSGGKCSVLVSLSISF